MWAVFFGSARRGSTTWWASVSVCCRPERVAFGGVKQSDWGREGSHHSMADDVEIKYVCLGDIQR